MSFLILDNSRKSSAALKSQLSSLIERPVHLFSNLGELKEAFRKSLPIPEVVLLDQDDDEFGGSRSIQEWIEIQRAPETAQLLQSSAWIVMGTAPIPSSVIFADVYLRKPVYPKKLGRALLRSYESAQRRKVSLGYLSRISPSGLLRQLPRTSTFWKSLVRLDSEKFHPSSTIELGAVFIFPEGLTEAELQLLKRIKRLPVSNRSLLIGVGKSPAQTHFLRTIADYFIPEEPDWELILERLERRRSHRLESDLRLKRLAHPFRAQYRSYFGLRRILTQDPWELRARDLLAEYWLKKGRHEDSQSEWVTILDLNPCLPKPYLKLLELNRRPNFELSSEALSWLRQAKAYCPDLREFREIFS